MRTRLQIVADHYAASDRQDITGMMAEVSPDVTLDRDGRFSLCRHLDRPRSGHRQCFRCHWAANGRTIALRLRS